MKNIFSFKSFDEKSFDEKGIILSGNQSLTRGIIESGCGFASIYPGTPVSEVGDFLYKWSKIEKDFKFVFDYSINEIVALESAIGAAWSGIRSAVIFKHLGMNIASDALHSIMYSGIGGDNGAGLVIICGGDPQSSSSTNAMDVRVHSLHSKLPILYPSSVEELYVFVKIAFDLSEAIDLPVMVYTTSKLSFSTGFVNLGFIKKPNDNPDFKRDMNRYINAIHFAINNQKALISKIDRLKSINITKKSTSNKLSEVLSKLQEYIDVDNNLIGGKCEFAIITGSLPYVYTKELLSDYELQNKIPILKINVIFPVNKPSILEFIKKFNPLKLIIIEELEPLLEDSIKSILYDANILIPIYGKNIFPRYGELKYSKIKESVKELLKLPINNKIVKMEEEIYNFNAQIPVREPTFCPGCSHRNVFYALRKVADKSMKKNGLDIIFGGDIGCYTMGMSSPYSAMDWLISMGAGIGIASGMGKIFKQIKNPNKRIVALIGDSTFFHSGIQGLINILKEDLGITIIILNNYYVAMTGHQPTLTSIPKSMFPDGNIGFQYEQLDLSKFLRGIGVKNLTTLNGYEIPTLIKSFEKIIIGKAGNNNNDGNKLEGETKVILINSQCALMTKKIAKEKWELPRGSLRGPELYISISESCPKCHECYERYGCTAIKYVKDEKLEYRYIIDEDACLKEYCSSCLDICPNNCIEKIQVNTHLDLKITNTNEKKNKKNDGGNS